MATSLSPQRPAPTGPRPVLWTWAEFHRLGDAGAFEGRRAMFTGGVILEEGPTERRHARVARLGRGLGVRPASRRQTERVVVPGVFGV